MKHCTYFCRSGGGMRDRSGKGCTGEGRLEEIRGREVSVVYVQRQQQKEYKGFSFFTEK